MPWETRSVLSLRRIMALFGRSSVLLAGASCGSGPRVLITMQPRLSGKSGRAEIAARKCLGRGRGSIDPPVHAAGTDFVPDAPAAGTGIETDTHDSSARLQPLGPGSLRMNRDFEELDYRETPLGELSLRRRRILSLGGREIFEVKLGEAFLMSSLFHEVEVALADLAL